jgi:hypothetical protein
MIFKNAPSTKCAQDETGCIPIVAEPLEGHSDDEVLTLLEQLRASKIHLLASSYISARISLDAIEPLEAVARVSLKTRSVPITAEP